MEIAWIGCGVMGKSMANNLIAKGYEVHVFSRTLSKLKDMKTIFQYDNIKDCIEGCDIICSMVGYPSDVEDIYFKDGILDHAKDGTILVDMTTSSPVLARKIAKASSRFKVLDAPVSGGDLGAKNATLSIMVGGDQDTFQKMQPIFEVLGNNINYIGKHGMGQHCKMCNQIAVAGATAAYSEALVYAQANSLDPAIVLQAIGSGAAGSWQLQNMAPRALSGDFDPGFFIKHFTKDMRIAMESMTEKGMELSMLKSVYNMYETLEQSGMEDLGTQALIKYYD